MKRTEKSTANSRKEKSKANSKQDKTRANSRQSKPKDCDRDKAKYEGKSPTEEKLQQSIQSASQSRSFQEPMHISSTEQQGQKELKLGEGIAKIPEIDFNEEIVEYKRIMQLSN